MSKINIKLPTINKKAKNEKDHLKTKVHKKHKGMF